MLTTRQMIVLECIRAVTSSRTEGLSTEECEAIVADGRFSVCLQVLCKHGWMLRYLGKSSEEHEVDFMSSYKLE